MPERIDPARLVGRAITGAMADRLLPDRIEGGPGVEPPGGDSTYAHSDLVYWHLLGLTVEFEGLGWVDFLTTTDEIELRVVGRHPSGFGGKGGRHRKLDAPAPLAALLGATVSGVNPLCWRPPPAWGWPADERYECGFILETTKGTVAIADAGDEYAVGEWPDRERWAALGVVTDF